jgi:phage terminase Nu1 subunit (DNA packaging protein)
VEVSQKALAQLFDVSPRTIQRWDGDGLDESRIDGTATYNLKEAIAWRLDSVQADVDDAYRTARTRLTNARADEAEREGHVRASELVERSDVAKLVRAPLEAVNRTLLAAPRRHAPALARKAGVPEADALVVLEEIVEEALRADLRGLATDAS